MASTEVLDERMPVDHEARCPVSLKSAHRPRSAAHRVEAAVKMSQNKSGADASGVLAGFIADGNSAVAEWVERVTG
ncbi:unannotated protein [freshwater metagenome]|uniref:Unannotated protein n=1 Tax=freshwater metagenome TaxID=449393 RepID=A0A6J7G8K2_9ZZZZ